MIPVLAIVGATASGKSAFAVKAAKALSGEVVSADAMQVYKYLDIGTAKVTAEEMENVAHHLIDVLEPDDDCNVSRFVDMAEKCIEDIYKRGKIAVLCGGTGLYVDSLLKGAAFEEQSCDDAYRQKLLDIADAEGTDKLYKMLSAVDIKAAESIHPNNVKRVIRALEFYYVTGKSITTQKANTSNTKYKPFVIGMHRDREALYKSIDERVDKMVADGLFEEVENLLKKGIDKKCNSMQAIGYREVIWYFEGKCTADEAKRLIKRNSRRYAKRQLTWFGANNSIHWINPLNGDEVDQILDKAREELIER